MNYPELIWHLIELVLPKAKDHNQEIDEVKKELSATTHLVQTLYELFVYLIKLNIVYYIFYYMSNYF